VKLGCEQLEHRDCPATWAVPTETVWGHFSGRVDQDRADVALAGGSAHVVVTSGTTGEVLLDTIAFDPAFRGGGHVGRLTRKEGYVDYEIREPESLIVTPGAGGGPVVNVFKFDLSTGKMGLKSSTFAPYGEDYRGGLRVNQATRSVLGGEPIPTFLPDSPGYAPRFVAIDVDSGETVADFYVGPPDDLSGQTYFEPTGGTRADRFNRPVIVVQDAPPDAIGYVPTRLYTFPDGIDVTTDGR